MTDQQWQDWLWHWWRVQWDMRHAEPPACAVCDAAGLLVLTDRQDRRDGQAMLWDDIIVLCERCHDRLEQLLARRRGGPWAGMPRPVAVDTLVAELASGRTPIADPPDGSAPPGGGG